jgi:hypothetical protein
LNAGVSRESAIWQFDMKSAGSKLHYDNLTWNVFNADIGYKFGGSTAMEIGGGIVYGMQGGESTMVDDDITAGGWEVTKWVDENDKTIGYQIGHALSIGTTSGGSMFGYNLAFGLTDFFQIGSLKMTPKIGWRSLSYKLTTSNNHGLSVDTAQCFEIDGEIQCDPAVVINYGDGKQQILWRDKITDYMPIGAGGQTIDPQGTYAFSQSGNSHIYNVDWSGPYLALDMRYDINANNYVGGHIELGMPGYKATGDQPYRFDWAHPTSVEDSAGIMSAIHFALGADWSTALTDSMSLTVGLTYDYYSVSGASAKTYLNGTYYNNLRNDALAIISAGVGGTITIDGELSEPLTEQNIKNATNLRDHINKLENTDCPGWVCSADGEIESFYKSMGARVGLAVRF